MRNVEQSQAVPAKVRIDAFSGCQLRCPLCPITSGAGYELIGKGGLDPADFENLLAANPGIRSVELSNSGEALLNPRLVEILAIAARHGVATTFDQGLNFNHAPSTVLEAMVTCGTRSVRVSLDAATPQSYGRYRVGGSFAKVVRNIARLTQLKQRHASAFPEITIQFILFSHNEAEVGHVQMLAKALGAGLDIRLNWSPDIFRLDDPDQARRLTGDADRDEHLRRTGRHYAWRDCLHLWASPQINWDGRLLGCGRNHWTEMAPDCFGAGLSAAIQSAGMTRAREIVMGSRPAEASDACSRCGVYRAMAQTGNWLTPEEVAQAVTPAEPG